MKSLISKQVERFLREQKNYKRWLAVFLCLAVVVTIGTTAALKYKGIAVTGDAEAAEEMHMEQSEEIPEGMRRHVHTEACYEEQQVLICEAAKAESGNMADAGIADTGASKKPADTVNTAQGHQHSNSCYEVTGGEEKFTCTKEEHSHGDGCYEIKTVEEEVTETVKKTDGDGNEYEEEVKKTVTHEERGELTCTKEEHSHGSDCYEVEGGERKLVCGLEEGAVTVAAEDAGVEATAENTEAAAVEDTAAEATEGAVSEHVHDKSCYEPQKVLICGKEEGELEEIPEEEFTAGTLTYKGEDYEVIVSYGANAKIPANAELSVEEFEADSDEYKECYEQMIEALMKEKGEESETPEITFARFFDITILVDGEEREPEPDAGVSVKINYDDVITEDDGQNGFAVHFPDDGEVEIIDADVKDGKEFGFKQNSFSTSGTMLVAYAAQEGQTIILNGEEPDPIIMQPDDTITLSFKRQNDGQINSITFSCEKDPENCVTATKNNNQVIVKANVNGNASLEVQGTYNNNNNGRQQNTPTTTINIIVGNPPKYEVVYDLSSPIEGSERVGYSSKDFTEEQITTGTLTDDNEGAGIEFPYTPKSFDYMIVKDGSGKYRYYKFDGWKANNRTIADGSKITASNAKNYSSQETDENGEIVRTIELVPVWTEADEDEKKTEVNFFVNLNCEIATSGTNQGNENYTTSIFETTTNVGFNAGNFPDVYIDSPQDGLNHRDDGRSISGQHVVSRAIIAKDKDCDPKDVDKLIRSLAATGVSVKDASEKLGVTYKGVASGEDFTYRLGDFPTDEAMLAKLRDYQTNTPDGRDKIKIDNAVIPADDLTADNFTIRWFTFHHNTYDGWHVDGVLVRKAGKLAVTKTFYGNEAAIDAIKQNFNVTVNGDNKSYTLKLRDGKDDSDTATELGYDYIEEQEGKTTYTWVLNVTPDKVFSVGENSYNYSKNSEIATLAEYRISNPSEKTTAVDNWQVYSTAVNVTTESYADDLDYKNYQTVNFQNSYLPKNSIEIRKYDADTKEGLSGVSFELIKDGVAQTVYKNGTDYYLYSPGGITTEQTTELRVGSNGHLVICGLQDTRAAGTFILREKDHPAGYEAEDITFTIGADGTVTLGTNEDRDKLTVADRAKKAYALNVPNSSETMDIVVRKEWLGVENNEKLPVTVQLLKNGIGTSHTVTLDSGNSWEYTFTGLPIYVNGEEAEYSLRETWIGNTAYDSGADEDGYQFYDVSVGSIAKVTENGKTTGTLVIRNAVEGGTLNFTKTDTSGKRLGGATFTLFTTENCAAGSEVQSATSNNSGEVRFIGLTEDTYYMKETVAPTGYEVSEQIYKVTFTNKTGKIELYPASATGETPEGESIMVITNEVAKKTIDIVKVDAAGNRLNDAAFILTATELDIAGSFTPAQDGYTSHKEDGENGEEGVVVKGLELPYGTYRLTETNAPANYREADPITLTVNANGVNVSGTEGQYKLTTPTEATDTTPATPYVLEVKNTLDMLSGITLTKISGENSEIKLGGAEFVLGRGTGENVRYAVIGENGDILNWDAENAEDATPITTADGTGIGILPTLEVGSYFLEEITAPDGYNLLTAPVGFEIRRNTETGVLDLAISDGSATKDGEKNIVISNSTGLELPEAGGPGTIAYTFGGLAMIIAVSLMYGLNMRRKRGKGGMM